jgi:hypothetical protein
MLPDVLVQSPGRGRGRRLGEWTRRGLRAKTPHNRVGKRRRLRQSLDYGALRRQWARGRRLRTCRDLTNRLRWHVLVLIGECGATSVGLSKHFAERRRGTGPLKWPSPYGEARLVDFANAGATFCVWVGSFGEGRASGVVYVKVSVVCA